MPPTRIKQRRRHRRKTDDPSKAHTKPSAVSEPSAQGDNKVKVTQYFSAAEAALIFATVLLGFSHIVWGMKWMSLAMMMSVWVLAGFWGVRLLTERSGFLVMTPVGAPIALLAIFLAGLYLFGGATVAGKPSFWLLVTCGAFFFALVHTVRHRWQLHFSFWMLMGFGTLLAGYAIVNLFGTPQGDMSSVVGFSADQVSCVMLLVIPMLGAATCLTRLPGGLKMLLLCAMIVMVLTVVLAFSRSAWLATFCMLGVLFVLLVRQGVLRAVWVPLIAVAFVALIGVGIAMSPYMKSRLQQGHIFHPPDPQRLSSWDSSLRMGADHPFFGVGPGMFPANFPSYSADAGETIPESASSEWLQMFSESGVVGIAIVVWLLATLTLSSLRLIRKWKLPNWFWYQDETQNFGIRHGLTVGMIAAVAGFLVFTIFNSTLHQPGPAIVFASIIAISMSGSRRWGHRHQQGGPATQAREEEEQLFQPTHLKPIYSRALGTVVLATSIVFAFWIGRAMAASVAVGLGDKQMVEAANHDDKAEATKIFSKARQHYERALKWDSSDYTAALKLGDFHMERAGQVTPDKVADEIRDAILYYGIATQLTPHDAQAWVGLGRACDKVKDEMKFSSSDDPEGIDTKSHKAFNEASMREPRNPQIHIASAEHWLLWNERERARESLSNAEKNVTEKYLRSHPKVKRTIAALREKIVTSDSSRKENDAPSVKTAVEEPKTPPAVSENPSKSPSVNGGSVAPTEESSPSR